MTICNIDNTIAQINVPSHSFTYIDKEKCFDYILPLSNDKVVSDVSVLKLKDNPSDHLPVIGYV